MSSNIRPLHLHTVDSLCAELVAGREITVGKENAIFSLKSTHARSVLQWYFKNRQKWHGNVNVADVNLIVDSIGISPESVDSIPASKLKDKKLFTLVKIQARQFAGLHHTSTTSNLPDDFTYEFKSPVTFFEGWNGSGKTSILNAIIWALTGEIIRPQRLPESATNEFVCEIEPESESGMISEHKISPITPLPDLSIERPETSNISAASWVELTFKDESENLVTLKRAQSRTSRGKLEETVAGLEAFDLDPVAFRIGTVMPGMLPFIQVGMESRLGKAVAELTGMAPLVSLASHAKKSKKKIDGDLTKERQNKIIELDSAYIQSLTDYSELLTKYTFLLPPKSIPNPSNDDAIEGILDSVSTFFEDLKSSSLKDAETVLGSEFDATNSSARKDLELNIAPALTIVNDLSQLVSISRLASLKKITSDEIETVESNIKDIFDEADTLIELASNPSKAGRIRLYSFMNAWSKDHPELVINTKTCLLCTHEIGDALDPVTGVKVAQHLEDASNSDSVLLSNTLSNWAEITLGKLVKDLPSALQFEVKKELPDHPGHLVVKAITEELFEKSPFKGVLKVLKASTEEICENIISKCPPLEVPLFPDFSKELPELKNLQTTISKIDCAVRFCKWRSVNKSIFLEFMTKAVGLLEKEGVETDKNSLLGKLLRLQEIVSGVDPINQALVLASRMLDKIKSRRLEEARLEAYINASSALDECMKVGELAETQVKELQTLLQDSAVKWRKLIYQGAFPSTERHLQATRMNSDGHLEFFVGAEGVSAPAQHVANASALRASLVGFFFAYWNYLLKERGGLKILLLDDPQELLDGDNRERLAESLPEIVKENGQLILTTHDRKFSTLVNNSFQSSPYEGDFQYIHPATKIRPTLFCSPSLADVQKSYDKYVSDINNSEYSQNYVSECRLFIEGRLGDLFDDSAFPSASTIKFKPTLMDHMGRLRGLVKSSSNELYKSKILQEFCTHKALLDNSPTLALLNKAHHAKSTIQPNEVNAASYDLEQIRRKVELVHHEFRLFCRRNALQKLPSTFKTKPLDSSPIPNFSVVIQPNLAAFVRGATVGESQEVDLDKIDSVWFDDKAFYLLRAGNLGFAGPATSVVIVEINPSKAEDRSLVIARRKNEVYARRLLRNKDQDTIALSAEALDPRRSPPTILSNESDFMLHKIVGILFENVSNPPNSGEEAVKIDGSNMLQNVHSAYRVKEDSAVPLALSGQIALGKAIIELDKLDNFIDSYVALHLSDGSSIFKRVGKKLPSPFSHLRSFETIGGLGVAETLSVNQAQDGFRTLEQAVLISGVLYHD